MAAINRNSLVARDPATALGRIAKRSNWAAQEAGVVVVFSIVFVVAVGLAGLWISRCLQRRKERKQAQEVLA
jgi:spore maturation protein SpmA